MSGFNASATGPQSLGENTAMPWDAKSFASRHNKKLAGTPAAGAAARQATAMVREGVPDSIAIATANKRANKLMKRGHVSRRAHERAESAATERAERRGERPHREPGDVDAASR